MGAPSTFLIRVGPPAEKKPVRSRKKLKYFHTGACNRKKRTAEYRSVELLHSDFFRIKKIDRTPSFNIRHSLIGIRYSLFTKFHRRKKAPAREGRGREKAFYAF
jgi:hypothetical protein